MDGSNAAAPRPRIAPRLRIAMLSHLVWERTLFQRPQQLATRFAALGCEVEYHALMPSRRWLASPGERRIAFADGGLAVNHAFLPGSGRFPALGRLCIRRLVRAAGRFLAGGPPGRRVLWLQHPGYYPEVGATARDALVYDCMDPFASFAKTAAWAARAEDDLLARADASFTGGRALHAAREGKSPNAHCFPSGIDFEHFAQGASDGAIAPEVGFLRKPVLGYIGAVDERIDWPLVEALCDAEPDASIVFAGPILDGARPLPERPNLHFLGGIAYERLPELLRGFDACLIPWKVNELTQAMSPTKTPEYLASGRPVVSTPIPDVVGDYGGEVQIAATPAEFAAACRRAVDAGTGPARKPPQARTWEEAAEAMLEIIERAISERAAGK